MYPLLYSMELLRDKTFLVISYHVSIHGKIFMFASKQCPQVPKHFEIHGKIFTISAKIAKDLALKRFVLYDKPAYVYVHICM